MQWDKKITHDMTEQTRYAVQFYVRKYIDFVNNKDGGILGKGDVTADRIPDENNNKKQSASARTEVHENAKNESKENIANQHQRDSEDDMEEGNDSDNANIDIFYNSWN